jgi:hypothetical protein
MAKKITTEISIKAPLEKVWSILTDFDNYPNWNPFIKFVKGTVEKGNQIIIRIEPPKGTGMTFTPTIITKIENKELSWLGKLLFTGLFDGEHKFELIDNGNGTITFIQREQFKGIFVCLFSTEKTKNGFNEMNEKLKELAERK